MKKLILLSAILLMIGCKKEEAVAKNNTSISNYKTTETTSVTADTAFFSFDSKSRQNEYVLVHALGIKYDKDSICLAKFRLDFIQNRKQIHTQNVEIKGFDEGSVWSAGYELDSVASPLKNVSVGYEACGYTQTHFLFYIDGKKSELIHQWESMSDSGWGSWGEIVSGMPTDFYFRTEAFSPADETAEGDDEWGFNEFSDSTRFQLKNGKWVKTLLTEKGKTYRSKKLTFNKYHKAEE